MSYVHIYNCSTSIFKTQQNNLPWRLARWIFCRQLGVYFVHQAAAVMGWSSYKMLVLSHHFWWLGARDRKSEGLWRWSYHCQECGGILFFYYYHAFQNFIVKIHQKIPLPQNGVLAPESAHTWPSAWPPIDTSKKLSVLVSEGEGQNFKTFSYQFSRHFWQF